MKRYFSPNGKKVIFFDLNGTIIDLQASLESSFKETLEEFTGRWYSEGSGWDPDKILLKYRKLRKTMAQQRHQSSILKETFRGTPIPVNDEFLRSFSRRWKELKAEIVEPYPDVKNTLEKLASRYTLAIISNGNRARRTAQLRRLGIRNIIPDDRLFTPVNGWKKPDPGMFKYALEQLNIPASQAVMVGDSWKNDVFGATRAGMDAVWIRRLGKTSSTMRKVGREKVIMLRSCRQLTEIF
ncbi:HAD family hydrolase [Ferviditalea candida]|uniref:HAD family hydrolase n=1 Tax=Ferviditalea candida TaxID=3108399 RepID=A0ABU5ZDC9_9BACL|nr:HAD family hydrolase [Paenibacillaceae bacterium T2]